MKVNRDASPRRKPTGPTAIIHFVGETREFETTFVIPFSFLDSDAFDLFKYWSTLDNIHTHNRKDTPESVQTVETKYYTLFFGNDGDEDPSLVGFRNDESHIVVDNASETFTISTFD